MGFSNLIEAKLLKKLSPCRVRRPKFELVHIHPSVDIVKCQKYLKTCTAYNGKLILFRIKPMNDLRKKINLRVFYKMPLIPDTGIEPKMTNEHAENTRFSSKTLS